MPWMFGFDSRSPSLQIHFARQIDRITRIAPIANIILLVGNIGLSAAGFLIWRGGHPLLWALLASIMVGLLVIVGANLWAGRLDMIRAMRSSGAFHDPTQVYQFTPWERIVWRYSVIPQMQALVKMAEPLGLETPQLKAYIELLKSWEHIGYIPRDQYPEDLLEYYYGDGRKL